MRVYDLTHTVSEDILVWPGTEKPRLSEGSTFEKDGFRETRLEIFSHVGTHMDAPAHMRRDRPQLDELPASAFCGSAWVLDARDCAPGVEIGPEAVEPVKGADFLLVCTGWDRYWNSEKYFGRYPVLSVAAVERAVRLGVRGIGLDTMGIDPMDDADFTRHHIMFEKGLVIVENLRGLAELAGRRLFFAALPLKYKNADGAPVRAVGIEGLGWGSAQRDV